MNETTRLTAPDLAAVQPKSFLRLVCVHDDIADDVPFDDVSRSGMVIVFGFTVLGCVLMGTLIGMLA